MAVNQWKMPPNLSKCNGLKDSDVYKLLLKHQLGNQDFRFNEQTSDIFYSLVLW